MRHLFIRARKPSTVPPLIDELLGLGLPRGSIRVYGNQAPHGLGVEVVRWRSRSQAFLEGAAFGGTAVFVLALGLGGAMGPEVLALLALAAVVGGLIRWRWVRARIAPLDPQKDALGEGELILALALDDDRLGAVQKSLAKRHPELMILGSDPAGTPPFP